MKTSELTGAALDWAVAKCMWPEEIGNTVPFHQDGSDYAPSRKWAHGGPIIERERMAIRFVPECYWHFTTPTDTWTANYEGGGEWIGPTPLVAAMRCFVVSKLGEEVDLPGELA